MASHVGRDIFRALHEHKWLSVEYRNASGGTTHYWVGIKDIDPKARKLTVQGFHLGSHEAKELTIRVDSILDSAVVEGTYFRTDPKLLQRIDVDDEKYRSIFGTVPSLQVLDYLSDCAKLNATPYARRFSLVSRVDEDTFDGHHIALDQDQFDQAIRVLQGRAKRERQDAVARDNGQLALNLMSVRSSKGLYVLAYRNVRLDVDRRELAIGKDTVLCREFYVGEGQARERQSVRRYLDESSIYLLDDFDAHREDVKDLVARRCGMGELVDDEPYLVEISRKQPTNLQVEYDAICGMYQTVEVAVPIRAFFGELTKRPTRRKDYPLVLLDRKINLDQLLAINRAIKYPMAYVQGPPGTGKTTTIVNTIINAFYNGQTVLFASNNNHPVDGVFASLAGIRGPGGEAMDFPVIRLGNAQMVERAVDQMRDQYLRVKDRKTVSTKTETDEADVERSRALTELLENYDRMLDLRERRECIETLAQESRNLTFTTELQADQLHAIDAQLQRVGNPEATLRQALSLVTADLDEVVATLEQMSVNRIKRLGHKQYQELYDIVMSDEGAKERGLALSKYLSVQANLKAFLRIYPIVATTCISAHRLGAPTPTFDMTIIDEASQCDTANALVPIIRGQSLLLVGDPQQLNPVVLIDEADNRALRRGYRIPDEYDYVENSVYKCFLACDSVSDEILLSTHYRCDERIISFNNRKYYNGRLKIASGRRLPEALTFIDVSSDSATSKNTAPAEARAVISYAQDHPDERIGVITPFANQREYLLGAMEAAGLDNVSCGTVHAFQGDETDVILFSLALTDKTSPKTYEWLSGNRELINVATSRAKDKLVIVSSQRELDRLHQTRDGTDDLYELAQYVRSNGTTEVTPRNVQSRALGTKPYSTKTEAAFLESLNHALDNIFMSTARHVVEREVPIKHVFQEDVAEEYLFYSGDFDFVIYEVQPDRSKLPILAIELDGKEHHESEAVIRRDRQKNEICRRHGFQLIRVDNTYARRYNYIKAILIDFFRKQ